MRERLRIVSNDNLNYYIYTDSIELAISYSTYTRAVKAKSALEQLIRNVEWLGQYEYYVRRCGSSFYIGAGLVKAKINWREEE